MNNANMIKQLYDENNALKQAGFITPEMIVNFEREITGLQRKVSEASAIAIAQANTIKRLKEANIFKFWKFKRTGEI